MKLALSSLVVTAVAVRAASDTFDACMLGCMANSSSGLTTWGNSSCASADYNETSCLCDFAWQTMVKDCLYETTFDNSTCNVNVPVWFDIVNDQCAAVTGTASSSAAAATSAAATSAAASASASSSSSLAVIKSVGPIGCAFVAISGVIGGAMLL